MQRACAFTGEEDVELTPGTTYHYWLESVDVHGVTAQHGPVSATFVGPTAVALERLTAGTVPPSPARLWALILPALLAAGAGMAARFRRSAA